MRCITLVQKTKFIVVNVANNLKKAIYIIIGFVMI